MAWVICIGDWSEAYDMAMLYCYPSDMGCGAARCQGGILLSG